MRPPTALACVALLTAFTLAPPSAAAEGPQDPPPGWPFQCTPGPAPWAPVPLRAFRTLDGILLHWDDELNPLADVPVDAYLVYRSLDHALPGQPYAILQGVHDRFLDPAGSPEHSYWVRAANCAGPGQPSNSASAAFPYTCADWDLDTSKPIPLNSVWVDRRCGGGSPCLVIVTVMPPDVEEWC